MNEILYYDLMKTSGSAANLNLASHVSREMGRRIVGGYIAEGSLIEDENSLATRFGVSKTVIREAVKSLAYKGLVDVRRGSGTRVRRRADWMLLDDDVLAWHLSVEPKPNFLRQLMDVRRTMEPKAAAWAATRGTDKQHQDIQQAQNTMERECRSVEDFVVADALFHRSILRAANNEVLRSMEGVIISALLNSIKITNTAPGTNRSSIPFHQALLEAILERDAAEAEERMKLHLEDTNRRLSDAIEEYSSRR